MSGGSSAYYNPGSSSSAVRSHAGVSVDVSHEGEASVPAVLFAEFLVSFFFVFLGGAAVAITGNIDAENRTFLRIVTIALIGQDQQRQTAAAAGRSAHCDLWDSFSVR